MRNSLKLQGEIRQAPEMRRLQLFGEESGKGGRQGGVWI